MNDLSDIFSFKSEIYKRIFDHHPDSVIVSTSEGIIRHCNSATLSLLDISYDSLIGKSLGKLFSDVAWLDLMSSKVVQGARYFKKDKTEIICDITIQDIESDSIYIIYLSQSVGKNTAHELQESLNRFETLAQLAPIGIFLVDANGQNLFVNAKWKELSGITSEEARHTGWTKAIYHEDLKLVQDGWAALLKEEKPFDYEYRYINQQTKKITDVHCLTVPFLDEHERATGYVGVVQDISYAKQLRTKLEVSNQNLTKEVYDRKSALTTNQDKLKKACRLARLGHWEVSLEDEFKISWSEEYIELYEPNKEVNFDNPRFFLQFTHEDDVDKLLEVTTQAIRHGTDTLIEYRITTGTGKLKYLQEEVQCQKNDDGKVLRIFGVTQDITDLKSSEQKLLKALEQERNLSVLKSRFVSMASHEFRTPLTTIMSSAELIQLYIDKKDGEKANKHAGKITASVGHLTYILEDFLSLEKVESGNVQIRKETIKLSEFMQEILEEMSLITKAHEISYQHKGEDTIDVDTHILRNILINLISNAIKYSPEEEGIKIASEYTDLKTLSMSVHDQGLGIPLEEQQHMFRRFFRASNTSNIQGTGLGLTIVSRYLEIVGGSIDFVSKPGEGTTFNITIPIRDEE